MSKRSEITPDATTCITRDPSNGYDGYRHCSCRDCFEICIGPAGTFCDHCKEAGCPDYQRQPGMSQECCSSSQ